MGVSSTIRKYAKEYRAKRFVWLMLRSVSLLSIPLNGKVERNFFRLCEFFCEETEERGRPPMKKLVMLLGSLWCLSAIPAYALQCGNRIVSLGESKTDVWHR